MIIPVEMYTAECDNCKCQAEFGEFSCYGDTSTVKENIQDQGWHYDHDSGLCYCENCFEIDDEDNVVIKKRNHE